jgi:hypothetical protein
MNSIDNTYDYDALRQRTEYAEAWKPAEGETLVGRVLRWETLQPEPTEPRTVEVMTVQAPDGKEWAVWTGRAQLRYKLIAGKETIGADSTGENVPHRERLVRKGDHMSVTFVGKRPLPDSTYDYAQYRAAVDPRDGEDAGEEDAEQGDIPF